MDRRDSVPHWQEEVGLPPSASDGRKTGGLHLFSSRSHAHAAGYCAAPPGRLFLLDPKFRPYKAEEDDTSASADSEFLRQNASLLTDIDKMHTYRDAMCETDVRAVAEAWCLFPGRPEEGESLIVYPTQIRDYLLERRASERCACARAMITRSCCCSSTGGFLME